MSMMPPPNHKQEKKSNNLHVEEVIVSQRHPLYVVLSFSETDYHSQFYSKLLPKQVRIAKETSPAVWHPALACKHDYIEEVASHF